MQNLDISIEDQRWDTLTATASFEGAVHAVLAHHAIPHNRAEISILACDDTEIARLNTDFRGKPTPTNVLSWPSEERAAMSPGGLPRPPEPGADGLIALGDIAISFDTCLREATAADKPMADHVTHLIIHATLHLLGYDHETEPDAALMEGLEVKLLGKLGLDDPYRMA